MSCCVPTAADDLGPVAGAIETDAVALDKLSRPLGDGLRQLDFVVPDAHCAACIRTLETALDELPQVTQARVNLSRRQVRVTYDPALGSPVEFAPAIVGSGYHTYLAEADSGEPDPVMRELVRAMAVAGFAAGNIMLFSVSVWAGADAATRDLFHWISALIALPAIVYAGRTFYRSAWRALRVGRTNMDVPITIGITLATALSLYDTMHSGHHAYFDGATTLLFFLLAGRTLDHMMRERARSAIGNLARLAPRGAVVIAADGSRDFVALDQIEPGMELELRAGERVPVDAVVLSGTANIDTSVVNGESLPRRVGSGDVLLAGTHNLDGVLRVRAEKRSTDSFLSRMAEMMETAESARTRPRRIADRASAVYAPIVHLTAFLTFGVWMVLSGGDIHQSLTNAVAVLIITCPCALALAVPMVHVVAAGRLFGARILMKDGAALERIAEIDHVAFDKTGTLTHGRPVLVEAWTADDEARAMAAALAASSRHPLSVALAGALPPAMQLAAEVAEISGQGVEARLAGVQWRLGRPDWCGGLASGSDTEVWVSRDGIPVAKFALADSARSEAPRMLQRLAALNLPVSLFSGDAEGPVRRLAGELRIADARWGLTPADKVAALERLGHPLMVGDGINDAPAMTAAYVSMAPASAADIGRSAADFVYLGNSLDAVPHTIDISRRAARLVRQNLTIAIGYNAIAVPLAVLGMVTPLIAAVAMSASSLVVVANALRLRFDGWPSLGALRATSEEARA